jgi:type VI secretion system secreted protein Hcp
MAVDSFLVFTPYNGQIWTSPEITQPPGLSDPFAPGQVPQNAFFPVLDWSMDLQQTLNIGSQATGAGAGKVAFNALSVTRVVDSFSPKLFQMAAAGTPFAYVDLLESRASASDPRGQAFLGWRFGLTAVASIAWSHDDYVKETVSFQYGSLTMQYFPQMPNGSFGKPVVAGWDRVKNVSL